MKSSVLCLAISLILTSLLFPGISHAIYTGNDQKQPQAEPTQLVVKFKSDVVLNLRPGPDGLVMSGRPELDALNQRYRVEKQAPLLREEAIRTPDNPLRNAHLIAVPPGTDIEEMAREYSRLDIVEYACPDYPIELYDVPNDPLYPHQWALNNTGQAYYSVLRLDGTYNDVLVLDTGIVDADIDAEEVLVNPPDQTATVVVAIVDTGVDLDHPDLAPVVWHNEDEIPDNGLDDDHNGYIDDVVGWDFTGWDLSNLESLDIVEDNDPTDTYGHGTHCAGIVAACINNGAGVCGVVPQAKIMGLKVDPSTFTMSCAARGIVYAADNGADVISMSWGAPDKMLAVEDALIYARSRGVVLIASNGNDGTEVLNYPASYPQTIAVGASNSLDQVTSFSTYDTLINVIAPGANILSLRADSTDMYAGASEPNVHIVDEYYYLADGTSMAGPYAAAVAAYLRAVSPGLRPEIVQDVIQSTADDIIDPYGTGENYPGWDKYSGYGRINLNAALAAVPHARAVIATPRNFEAVSGQLNIDGIADGDDFTGYVLEYNTGDTASGWTNISNSSSPVTDGLLGTLDTYSLNGPITIRLRVGDYSQAEVRVMIVNGATALISSPASGDTLAGIVSVSGTAMCPDFSMSVLSYSDKKSRMHYVPIDTITMLWYDTLLASWWTTKLANGTYNLRLDVFSHTGLAATQTITVELQQPFGAPNGWSIDMGEAICRTGNYADLDNDGVHEILIGTASGIKIFNADGTQRIHNIPDLPSTNFSYTPIAVGRLDGDDIDDFVAVDSIGMLYAYPSQAAPFQVKLATPANTMPGLFNLPVVYLKDINGDGLDEIHFFPGTAYYQVLDASGNFLVCDGNLFLQYHWIPADPNGDGIYEVYGLSTGRLMEFDYCDGVVDTVSVQIEGRNIQASQAEISAVDIDADGKEELIVFASIYDLYQPHLEDYRIFVYDEDLVLKESWPHNTGLDGYYTPTPPVFGDLDGDGILEYAAAVNNVIYAWRLDGTPFLEGGDSTGLFAISPGVGDYNTPLIADVDGDGQPDIIACTSPAIEDSYLTGEETIEAFDRWGQMIEGYPLQVSRIAGLDFHMPTIGDINGDGYVDILYPSTTNTLMFTNFPDADYHPELSFCPSLRYNRRMNLTLIPSELASGTTLIAKTATSTDADITVLVSLVDYQFNGGSMPVDMTKVDVAPLGAPDGVIDISDLVTLVNYMLQNGPTPSR